MARMLFDNETGEVIGEFDDNQIIMSYDINNLRRGHLNKKLFYKFYVDSVSIFTSGLLSLPVINTFFSLIKHLNMNTNEFVSFNGMPANIEQISIKLGVSRKTISNHLKILEKYDMIRKVKVGRQRHVLINPYFISYGNNNTDESLTIFSNTIWAKTTFKRKRKNL